jgi:(p)ppGpp synthase/HD superfamily hydrolase
MTEYEKLRISLRYYLLGKGYYNALQADQFASEYHTGFRKDGVTPEYEHQIRIAHYIRSISSSLLYPENTVASVLLHDVREDYGVKDSVLEQMFGKEVARSVWLLDKNGKTTEEYFRGLAEDAAGSIAKGGDRVHNIQTMVGVFSKEKQQKYIDEVRQYFLPMLKTARRNFPQQESAYENIKHMLVSQIELIEAFSGE